MDEKTPLMEYFLGSYDTRETIYNKTLRKMKILDLISFALSVTGLILIQIEADSFYDQINYSEYIHVKGGKILATFYKDEDENETNFSLRITIVALTCALIHVIRKRSEIYFYYMKITYNGILSSLLIEIIYNLLLSYPRANKNFEFYQEEHIMAILDLGRIYILARIWGQYSMWNDDKYQAIIELCNAQGGILFALKAAFKNTPFLVVGCYFTIAIFILGFCVRLSEISFSYELGMDWGYIWNSLWMVIIIMTTVGYGDIFCRTYFGRFFVFITCCLGPFLISLINVSILNISSFTREEEIGYRKIKYQENIIETINLASDCIKYSWKYWGELNLKLKSATEKNSLYLFSFHFGKMKSSLLSFHKMRINVNQQKYNRSFEDLLKSFNDKYDEETTYPIIIQYSTIMESINNRLFNIDRNQKIIHEKLDTVYENFDTIIKKLNFPKKINSKSVVNSNYYPLSFRELNETDEIQEILKRSGVSLLSIEPTSAEKRKERRKKTENSISGFHEMVRQLSKQVQVRDDKKNLDERIKDSPKGTYINNNNNCNNNNNNSNNSPTSSQLSSSKTFRGRNKGKKVTTKILKNEEKNEKSKKSTQFLEVPLNGSETNQFLLKKDYYGNENENENSPNFKGIDEDEIGSKTVFLAGDFPKEKIFELKLLSTNINENSKISLPKLENLEDNLERKNTLNLSRSPHYPQRTSNILNEEKSLTARSKEIDKSIIKQENSKGEVFFQNSERNYEEQNTLATRSNKKSMIDDQIFVTDLRNLYCDGLENKNNDNIIKSIHKISEDIKELKNFYDENKKEIIKGNI